MDDRLKKFILVITKTTTTTSMKKEKNTKYETHKRTTTMNTCSFIYVCESTSSGIGLHWILNWIVLRRALWRCTHTIFFFFVVAGCWLLLFFFYSFVVLFPFEVEATQWVHFSHFILLNAWLFLLCNFVLFFFSFSLLRFRLYVVSFFHLGSGQMQRIENKLST